MDGECVLIAAKLWTRKWYQVCQGSVPITKGTDQRYLEVHCTPLVLSRGPRIGNTAEPELTSLQRVLIKYSMEQNVLCHGWNAGQLYMQAMCSWNALR